MVLERVVAISARENLSSLLERCLERLMASALLDEMTILAAGVERNKVDDMVDSLWVALVEGEDPQCKGTLVVEWVPKEGRPWGYPGWGRRGGGRAERGDD